MLMMVFLLGAAVPTLSVDLPACLAGSCMADHDATTLMQLRMAVKDGMERSEEESEGKVAADEVGRGTADDKSAPPLPQVPRIRMHPENWIPIKYDKKYYESQPEVKKGNEGIGRRGEKHCNPLKSCGACASVSAFRGSCRWCPNVRAPDGRMGWCFGYNEFREYDQSRGVCGKEQAVKKDADLCPTAHSGEEGNMCRNEELSEWTDSTGYTADCAQRAVEGNCSSHSVTIKCQKACSIYSWNTPYLCGSYSIRGSVYDNKVAKSHRALVKSYRDLGPQVNDVLLVTEGGDLKTDVVHAIIRATAFGDYSHAIIVSSVTPKLMVFEAVSNVETFQGKKEPSGVREVAIEYAFAHVTKFGVWRKKGPCNLQKHLPPSVQNDVQWARDRINVPSMPHPAPYATMSSWVSVGHTPSYKGGWDKSGRVWEGWHNDAHVPDAFYCSQLVAWMLYVEGCAFTPTTNLNQDPEEMRKQLVDEWNYENIGAYEIQKD